MALDAACHTDPGGRAVNEDAVLFTREGELALAAVADGLGGHGGGEQASQAALKCLEERRACLLEMTREAVQEVLVQMNRAVLDRQSDRVHMKTTAAMAVIREDRCLLAHIGDSRIYHFRGGAVLYQSADHSVSQLAVLAGEITPQQIRFHEDRNRVLRVLGNDEPIRPDIRECRLERGDALLMCTDGFWEYVTEKEMLSALRWTRSAKDWLERMAKLRRRAAPRDSDNDSAVALRIR